MKFACFGYIDEEKLEKVQAGEMNTLVDECLAYDDVLRERGHFAGGEGLQSARKTTTLRYRNGEVRITDGPFAETKEQLAGFYMIEARDLNEAIQIAAKIPPAKFGSIEVRPTRELMAGVSQAAAAAGP